MDLKNLNQARPRINGAMFQKYMGKSVCVLGLAIQTDSSGTSFTLSTCDNQKITVRLALPVQECIQGLIEVHGVVKGSNELLSNNYILFSETKNFDMESYDKAITLAEEHPQHYLTSE